MFLLQASVKKIQKKAIKTSTTTCATYHVTSQEGCTTVAAGMCHTNGNKSDGGENILGGLPLALRWPLGYDNPY